MSALRLFGRQAFNHIMACIPVPIMRGFLKTFEFRLDLAERAGFHVFPRVFDSPLPIIEEINRAALDQPRPLPGLDLRLAQAGVRLEELSKFTGELDPVPEQRGSGTDCWLHNDTFDDFDAAVLYGLLRFLKPRRYIEVGCGFSSFFSSLALQRNRAETAPCEATYIDPEPRLPLDPGKLGGELLRLPIQRVSPALFQTLREGDVLFIDTSHVLKVQSDVVFELTEILPQLSPGVWVHIHDVFTPYDYLEKFVFQHCRLSWNEQYALECLLSGGARFRVEIPLYCLWKQERETLTRFFPRGCAEPHSFWISKSG